ncbi:two-component sensor histidine kinase [Streptomyces sp. WAC 06725]|uniref:sensor histidine kinase n=1 Tax=Streptomyces sp. WAC 06725 TaxID=2203209 RepID=UPI000F745CE8|nr:histidine kinase [Streptomyces sp. WAC 06725]RSO37517.1 two-component sensor histidine kinase [Streptomyces sp. WAC 06725]
MKRPGGFRGFSGFPGSPGFFGSLGFPDFPGGVRRGVSLAVPVLLSMVDAFLVNGLDMGLELGVSLVAAAALLLRRRLPLTVFLFTLPGLYIGYIWFAPMIALYTLAVVRAGRFRLGVCAVLLIAAHFLPYPVSDLDPGADRENIQVLIDATVTSAAPIALGLLVRTRRELAERIADLTHSLRREDRLIAERVLATERARLAREMHDVVAHQVSLISLQAGAVQVSAGEEAVRESARTIRELSVRTLEELRHMVGILRAAGGGAADARELAPQPDLAELPRLIKMSALDVDYEHEVPDGACGAKAVERAAFRTVQEALTNVRKHAPGARVRVRVAAVRDGQAADGDGGPGAPRGLRVEVRNGPPDASAPAPALPGGGHGLVGLRERAQSLGGLLEAGHTPDGGFLVRAEFPGGVG